MENITIGQIVASISILSVIGGFAYGIIAFVVKWWKSHVTDKFAAVDVKFEKVDNRLDNLEDKKEKYEKIAQESNEERMILLKGELATLKALYSIQKSDQITNLIDEIEDYMMHKSHDINSN